MSVASPRLAIIGISGYGRIHLNLMREWADRGAAQIVAAVVINADEERVAVDELVRRGCRIYSDYEAMLRAESGRIDLCFIPTGIHLHARMTIAALRAGANVLVEKPLAGALAETDAIRAAERESGRFVAVGFQDVYASSTAWLLDVLRSGKIGAVRAVRTLCVWPRPRSYFLRNNWAGRLVVNGAPVYDSPLNNACGHFVLLSLLFGDSATGDGPLALDSAELYRAHPIESFDSAVVTLTGPTGVKLWLGVSHSSRTAHSPEIIIEGTAGRARWIYEQEASWQDDSGRGEKRALNTQHEVRREMMAAVMARLADAQAPICTTGLAARHTAFIDAVHRWGPVQAFPERQIEWSSPVADSTAIPSVRGLDEALQAAFARGLSLGATGFAPMLVSSLG